MRAADDFAVIHARMEELRREQERPPRQDKDERLGARTPEDWNAKVAMSHRPWLA